MRALFSTLLAFITICVCAQPHTYTHVSDMELKGKVKSFSFERFNAIESKEGKIQNIVRSDNKLRIYFYNLAGYLDKEETYEITGTPEDTALLLISRFFYEKERVLKIINYGTLEELANTEFIVDSVDFIYKNDTMYSRVSETTLNDDSIRIISNFNYTITKNQHIIEQGGGQGLIFSSTKINFDDSGRKIKNVLEQKGKLHATSTYFYTDDSSLKPEYIESLNEDSGMKNKTQLWYNEYNDVIAKLEFNESKMTNNASYFEYDYDQHGNWTEKRSLDESGQLKNLVRRTITYWDE